MSNEHKDDPIYINVDHITAVFDVPSAQGGSLKTFVYGGYKGIQWEVEESPSQILKLIESVKYDS